ncbi:hypothetical protein ACHAPB_004300 [Verticillium nonalfalfae]
MDSKDASNMLAPPAVTSLRAQSAGVMERTFSEDIREEREELREAAEQTLNVILDLNLDGTIRWVSPSWSEVIGTTVTSVPGTSISDLILGDNKSVFSDVAEAMRSDDSRSQRVRFAVHAGPLSRLLSLDDLQDPQGSPEEPPAHAIELEAQGIMVYDVVSGGESHTMWMIRPWIAPREIQIDLPTVIVDSLGSGAEVLASYLTQLAESGVEDPENHPPPLPVLCRICERQISPWWFEKHTDLCLQEHRAEMDVQMAQENLTEHRHAIVKVLDALEARKSRSLTGEQPSLPLAEYKGLAIGPPPSSQSSPGTSVSQSRDRSGTGGFGHARARSFAIRRPQARIVELLVDLCDTAIEVSTPAIKESSSHAPGELRTQSPQSESRISQVMHWQSPSTNTLEQETGLALLCADTEKAAKAKVEAVFRHRKIIEYAERIRVEFAVIVQDCIDEAMRKAARIASGRLSDSTEDETEEEDQEITPAFEEPSFFQQDPTDNTSALAAALQQVSLGENADYTRPVSFVGSARSSSPKECPTPKSNFGGLANKATARDSRRGSIMFESDTGDSDGSIRSSSLASRQAPRTDSPISEFGDLRRAASSRQHHRRSLILPGTSSPRRQESPSRATQPSSPLRINKPRNFVFGHDGIASPEASPMMPGSEFSSPAVAAIHHHRRQSSAAMSEFAMKPPPSPRLGAHNPPPQARPAPPSIKDFEIIKPISKGAFGSVYLSKKKSTGEYFAIKVLKKADMVAKNQVGNVKAERAILMWQGQSEFVAKLYWTFSSKDYLYLVMEYLNGGDCASLIKVLGGLPEDWAKKYLGEVILGVEHLHSRDIIHRDLKPDNLLIDQKGHLKLTDFGLSRMGLVGRQKRALNNENSDPTPDLLKQGPFARSASMASSRSTSLDLHGNSPSPNLTPQSTPDVGASLGLGQPSYFSLGNPQQETRRVSSHRSDSGGSEALANMLQSFSLNDAESSSAIMPYAKSPVDARPDSNAASFPEANSFPKQSSLQSQSQSNLDTLKKSTPPQNSMMPPPMALFDPEDTNRRFVGTPDYLAPETINGEKQDETSDWWSVGCIMFEFMYGFPPFHAGEAEHVFENILARKIQWPDETECEISDEAKDLINKLLCMEPSKRLGSNLEDKFQSGGEEIRSHPWFNGINWDTLVEDEAQFVPQTEDPEDTEYFDARGAVLQSFAEEMEDQTSPPSSAAGSDYPDRPHDALSRVRSQVNSIKRGLMPLHIPPHVRDLKTRRLSEPVVADDFGSFAFKNLPVLEKANKDVIQKLRAEALASQNKPSTSPGGSATIALWTERGQLVAQPSVSAILAALGVLCDWTTRGRTTQGIEYILRPLAAIDHLTSVQRGDRHPQGASKPAEGCNIFISVTCQGSGPGASPIGIVTAKVDGNAETVELFIYWTIPLLDLRYSMSDIKFDIIFLEYRLPQINGADVARMIRETKNTNSHTPIVAITAYLKELQAPHYFDSLIEKPISSSKLSEVLKNLCRWKPQSPGQSQPLLLPHPAPSGLRRANSRFDDSPTSSSSLFAGQPGSSVVTSSREDSISSSMFGDSESVTTDEVPVVISRKATGEWDGGGLGIREEELLTANESHKTHPHLLTQHSAPAQIEQSLKPVPSQRLGEKSRVKKEGVDKRTTEGTDSADDEDDELGLARESKPFRVKPLLPSSKLGIEMMRADSHDSVALGSENLPEPITQVVTPSKELGAPPLDAVPGSTSQTTPPNTAGLAGSTTSLGIDETPRPNAVQRGSSGEEGEPTPRPTEKTGPLMG